MWLSVSITDAEGKYLYHSGKLNEKGIVDPNATIYHTVFGDKDGKPTLHVWSATQILSDNRVPPKGQKEESVTCLVPKDANSPLKITAVLNYRSAPQEVVDALLGEKSVKFPVIEMAEVSKEISL